MTLARGTDRRLNQPVGFSGPGDAIDDNQLGIDPWRIAVEPTGHHAHSHRLTGIAPQIALVSMVGEDPSDTALELRLLEHRCLPLRAIHRP